MTDFRIGVLTLAPSEFLWNILVQCRIGILEGSRVVTVVTPSFNNNPAFTMAGEFGAAQIVLGRSVSSESMSDALRQAFRNLEVNLVIDCKSCYPVSTEVREMFGGNWVRIVQPQQLRIVLASLAMRQRVSQRL